VLESNYNYTQVLGSCKTKKPKVAAKITNVYQRFTDGNETLYKDLLASVGPVITVMWVNNLFLSYAGGIFSDPKCPQDCVNATTNTFIANHAMIIVGYGTNTTVEPPVDYWILRNSWGPRWGEFGYARTVRNKDNNCNIACVAIWGS